ncbi:MAG: PAS domain-containing protein [Solirubrobacteraceae bacterium]
MSARGRRGGDPDPPLGVILEAIEVGVQIGRLEDPDDPAGIRLVYANQASVAATGVAVEAAVGRTLRDGERLLGRPRETLLGRRLLDVFPEAEDGSMWAARQRALLGRVTVVEEAHSPSLGKWLSARFYPTPHGVAAYVQDISERKQLEAQLLQSQNLEGGRAARQRRRARLQQCPDGDRGLQRAGSGQARRRPSARPGLTSC